MNKRTINYGKFQWIDFEDPSIESLSGKDLPLKVDMNYLEDALEPGHLPKLEKTSEYTFVILRAYTASEGEKAIEVGQISSKIAFFINENTVITIHRATFSFLNNMGETFESADELVLHIINGLIETFKDPIRTQAERMDALEQSIFLKAENSLSIENLYFEKAKARLLTRRGHKVNY